MAKTTDPRYLGSKAAAKERRRLFEQIERIENDIRLGQDTLKLQEKLSKEKRERKLARIEAAEARQLEQQALALLPAEEAAQAMLAKRLPGIQQRQRLAYRRLRQDLRRKEGLLDKAGRLKEGGQLSPASALKLEELQAKQEQELSDLHQQALSQAKAAQPSAEQLAQRQAEHQQAKEALSARLAQAKRQMLAKDQRRLSGYAKRQQAREQALEASLKQKQAQLLSSESQADHHLPEDVCLRLDELSMVFGGLRAVDNLSFDVKQGEIFGLIGPNGAGKTTVFNCITQFYKPTSGNILYRTREGNVLRLNNYDVHKIITKGIVRTFQNVEVIGELSILENLLIAAHAQYRSSLWHQIFNTRRVRQEEMVIRERALKVLDYCGLLHLKDFPPVGQPYGVLKRVELARTLMAGAHLIILDEPAAGLNDQETLELTELIRQIQKDYGATIFLVEHNMGLVMDLCDHICAISFGKKLAYGTPQEIQNDPVVQEAYLGTSDAEELEVRA